MAEAPAVGGRTLRSRAKPPSTLPPLKSKSKKRKNPEPAEAEEGGPAQETQGADAAKLRPVAGPGRLKVYVELVKRARAAPAAAPVAPTHGADLNEEVRASKKPKLQPPVRLEEEEELVHQDADDQEDKDKEEEVLSDKGKAKPLETDAALPLQPVRPRPRPHRPSVEERDFHNHQFGRAEDDTFSLARRHTGHSLFGHLALKEKNPETGELTTVFDTFEDGDTVRYDPVVDEADTADDEDYLDALNIMSPGLRSRQRSISRTSAPGQHSREHMPQREAPRAVRTRLTPDTLPPSSSPPKASSPIHALSPAIESELDDSSDEFGAQRAEKKRLYAKSREDRTRRGQCELPGDEEKDTEEEDAEEDAAFYAEEDLEGRRKTKKTVEAHAPASNPKKKQAGASKGRDGAARKRKQKAKAKGKAKEKETSEAGDEDDADDASGAGRSKGGPIPKELKDQLAAALDAYEAEVLQLAEEYGHDPEVLHKLVGTSTQAKFARALTAWNAWQSWYAENHPKKDFKGTTKEYTAKSRQAFKDALPNLFDEELKDSDKVFEQLAWLREWHDRTVANVVVTWRDKGKFKLHVQRAVAPLVHQSRLLHESLGVHVWGFCIDTQGQGSLIWGGTEEFKMWRSKKGNALNTEIKDMEHLLGVEEMKRRGDTGEAIVMPAHVLEGQNNEKVRDTHRRVFGLIMSKQLVQFLVAGGVVPKDHAEKYKMQWGEKFLDLAWEHKFRIINYPAALQDKNQIIGKNFNLKKLNVDDYAKFLPAMQRAISRQALEGEEESDEDDAMAIVAWDHDEKDLPDEEQGEVSLVDTSDGLSLLRVKHSKAYNRHLAGAAKKAATARKGKQAQRDERLSRLCSRSSSLSPGPTQHRRSTSSDAGRAGGRRPWARSRTHSPAPTGRGRSSSPNPGRGGANRPPGPPTRNDLHHRVEKALKPAPVRRPRSPAPAGGAGGTGRRSPPPGRRPRSPAPAGGAGRCSPPPARRARSPAYPPPPPCSRIAPGVRSALEARMALPRVDLLEMASKQNTKRKEHPRGATDRDRKRPRKEQGEGPSDRTGQASGSKYRDEEEPRRNDLRMKFKVPGPAKVFRATGFLPTDHPTRADRYTVYESTPGIWITIPPQMTPIIASRDDLNHYESEIEIHGLEG
ncbi:hypothetical protein DFH07DRAFT_974801 [Mycena maculata]|uniref:Uncharacterized protein n=1 Tax=Mycena maculata TaxID=230809 RepID=A0AAD7H6L8_9AGAR|nr:hypothetical protein DFH07DRAFT_974801 [Mycena maculata]